MRLTPDVVVIAIWLKGSLSLIVLMAAALYARIRYLLRYRTALLLEAPLVQLGQVLGPTWKAYLPKEPQAQSCARVLVSPNAQTFCVNLVQGQTEQKYGIPHVIRIASTPWPFSETCRDSTAVPSSDAVSGRSRRSTLIP